MFCGIAYIEIEKRVIMTEIPNPITLDVVSAFENYTIDVFEHGHVILSTEVVESSLNYYGKTHGGYLFTLCDQVGGLVARSAGATAVTLQANIHYLKPGNLGERLFVEGNLIHGGRTTQMVEVTVTNKEGVALTKVSITMFIIGDKATKK